MKIEEMHILFRQLAQQMGLQNVRGILPEQIDILLNTSILDILKQIIQTNIGLTNSNGIVTNSKIGQINSLQGLYLIEEYNCDKIDTERGFEIDETRIPDGVFVNTESFILPDYLYIVDVSVSYAKMEYGYKSLELFEENGYRTRKFNARLIEDINRNVALNDAILKPTLTSPIVNIVNNYVTIEVGKLNNLREGFVLDKGLGLKNVYIGYIKKPAVVDISNEIDCDLPLQFHNDIVKHSVEMFLQSIGIVNRNERSENNK